MDGDWDELLAALRWHWGEAYIINCLGAGLWIAERRDTHETLRDETPLGLRDRIIGDYTARPVSRSAPNRPAGSASSYCAGRRCGAGRKREWNHGSG